MARKHRYGIDELASHPHRWLRNDRVGLIAHHASVDASGCPSAVKLREIIGDRLVSLFSPEHGFFGIAGAGEKVTSVRHPVWGIPVHSLYGKSRRPTRAMFRDLDTVVFDLQDLSIRCYTYVSTLRLVLEAAAAHGVQVIVADRPNPLAHVVDGPMLDPACESFVGNFPGPLVYGLTAGEAALWLKKKLKLDVELDVIPMKHYRRGMALPTEQWISPSPGIRNPHTALCYPVTVCYEALPAVNCGRSGLMPFELIGAAGIDEAAMAGRLNDQKLPGIFFHPTVYESGGQVWQGIRAVVTDGRAYRPVATAVAVLATLQDVLGAKRLWRTRGSRPAFFDKLFGTAAVRRGIQSGTSWKKIVSAWPLGRWYRDTESIRLYRE